MNQADDQQSILVVDDAPENIQVLAGLLAPHYQVKVALNGEKALQIAAEQPLDLVLLDVMMPGLDGYEVCRRLKEDPRTRPIPVIFVTARGSVDDETHGFEAGAADYLSKPISPPIVLARVRTHLALYDQSRALEERVQEKTSELNQTRLEIIRRLGRAGEFKDNETGLHVIRMSHFAQLLARAYGLSDAEAELALHAAPMHDVGKIGIPDKILLKPGKLDADEWAIMRRHPAFGARILGRHASELLETARRVALTHHEKWDGSGYPAGLKGEQIPLHGRIVAIADVFDALTSERPYKKAWPLDRAVELVKSESGRHFDPSLAPVFLEILPDVQRIMVQYGEGTVQEEEPEPS